VLGLARYQLVTQIPLNPPHHLPLLAQPPPHTLPPHSYHPGGEAEGQAEHIASSLIAPLTICIRGLSPPPHPATTIPYPSISLQVQGISLGQTGGRWDGSGGVCRQLKK